jgi:hypothetical protein
VAKAVTGQPSKINDLVKAAFNNTIPADAPVEPNRYESDATNPFRRTNPPLQLPAAPVPMGPGPDTSFVRAVPAVPAPPTTKALPPASTFVQGDISPASGIPSEASKTLPTLEDTSGKVEGAKPSVITQNIAEDAAAKKYGLAKTYSEASPRQRDVIDRIVRGQSLRLQDLITLQER